MCRGRYISTILGGKKTARAYQYHATTQQATREKVDETAATKPVQSSPRPDAARPGTRLDLFGPLVGLFAGGVGPGPRLDLFGPLGPNRSNLVPGLAASDVIEGEHAAQRLPM